MKLIIGNKYKWKHEEHILEYIGNYHGWNQFTLNGKIWCEVSDFFIRHPIFHTIVLHLV